MNEKYIEDIIRYSIDRFALFMKTSLLKFGDLLETTLDGYSPNESRQLHLELGRYSIFGFFAIFTSIYYFFSLESLYSPPHVTYAFLVITVLGVILYVIKN